MGQRSQALLGVGARQAVEMLLEGVGHPAVAESDVRGPVVVQQFVRGEEFVQQPVEFAEVGEDHMAAEVPGEARPVHHR
ncbi:hypothetical protein [Streptomyces natalensis]|uniref:hypothetical protein n=1 Tax=Streptomyces natalensis TaxID=68242 RepID=UPI000A968AC9|nr:hypothetical protein [Streptomyces natalensis]